MLVLKHKDNQVSERFLNTAFQTMPGYPIRQACVALKALALSLTSNTVYRKCIATVHDIMYHPLYSI